MPKLSMPPSAITIRIFTVGLGVALFLDQAGARQMLHLDDSGGGPSMTPLYWINLLAPAFFLWAVWAASDVFVRIDRGEAFGPAMVRGLMQMGGGLMLGAWSSILAQPALTYLIGNGFRELRGVRLNYSVENLTLALVGLVLMLLARQGQTLKSKLDQFV